MISNVLISDLTHWDRTTAAVSPVSSLYARLG